MGDLSLPQISQNRFFFSHPVGTLGKYKYHQCYHKTNFLFLFLLGVNIWLSCSFIFLIGLFVYICQIAKGIEKQYLLLFAIFLGCQVLWESWLINVPDFSSVYHKCKWTVCGVACFQYCSDDYVAMVITEHTGSWDSISNAAAWNLISAPRLLPHISISLQQIEFQAVVSPMYSLGLLLCKIASLFYTLMIMKSLKSAAVRHAIYTTLPCSQQPLYGVHCR